MNYFLGIDIAKTSDKEVTNVDIMRRLSQLEKMVYGAKKEQTESVLTDLDEDDE